MVYQDARSSTFRDVLDSCDWGENGLSAGSERPAKRVKRDIDESDNGLEGVEWYDFSSQEFKNENAIHNWQVEPPELNFCDQNLNAGAQSVVAELGIFPHSNLLEDCQENEKEIDLFHELSALDSSQAYEDSFQQQYEAGHWGAYASNLNQNQGQGKTYPSLKLEDISVDHDERLAGVARPAFESLICYGAIIDIPAAYSKNLRGSSKADSKSSNESLHEVEFTAQGGSFDVRGKDGSYYGLLPSYMSKVLLILLEENSLRLQGYANIHGSSDHSYKQLVSVDIYGPEDIADDVGQALLDNDIYLQRPVRHDMRCEYRNPQLFVFGEGEVMDIDNCNGRMEDNYPRIGTFKSYELQDTLSTVFPSTPGPSLSQEYALSPLLKTTLMDHQIYGFRFMRDQEECGNTANGICGGIVADQPGLGKSLTTLALIASSLSDLDTGLETVNQSTLIVVPTPVLLSWEEQIDTHLHPNCISTATYHSSKRINPFTGSLSPNIVLTTYSTLVADLKARKSTLFEPNWYRVVLDEAHYIKDRSTKRFEAACALSTRRRWCLTGTPIQNRIDDLAGLLAYLRISRFNDHAYFQRRISNPLKNGNLEGLRALQTILWPIMLRRTKDAIDLPSREDVRIDLSLSTEERTTYDFVRNKSEFLISNCLRREDFSKGTSILQSILRQRQACTHGLELLSEDVRVRLIRQLKSSGHMKAEEEFPSFCEACDNEVSIRDCEIGFEACFHVICASCFKLHSATSESSAACPVCSGFSMLSNKGTSKTQSLQAWASGLRHTNPSTKVSALIANLRSMSRVDDGDGAPKSIVFSSWVKMLYLVGLALRNEGINFVRYDGSLSMSEREKVLADFRSNSGITVLLMSIGSGGVGLNLTVASHVHLMEPQWNPMVESQALDRVHRLGQTRPVKTYRYIAKNTFDESILSMQKKKLDLAELSLEHRDMTKTEKMRQRLKDLQDVFK